jgi:hypothetical protein
LAHALEGHFCGSHLGLAGAGGFELPRRLDHRRPHLVAGSVDLEPVPALLLWNWRSASPVNRAA